MSGHDPHERFRSLCIEAAHGAIAPHDWTAVKQHLEYCISCRRFLGDLATLFVDYFPHTEVGRAPNKIEDPQFHDSIVRALAREGANFSSEIKPEFAGGKAIVGSPPDRSVRWWQYRLRMAGAFTLLVVAVLLGGVYTRRQPPALSLTKQAVTATSATVRREEATKGAVGDKRDPEEELNELRVHERKLERETVAALHSNKELRRAVSDASDRNVMLASQLNDARASEAAAREGVERTKAEFQVQENSIVAQNREIVALNEELRQSAADKQRDEGVVVAEHRLSELVGARNLHMVDIYDVGPDGKTSHTVGRVFYTEGKALLFYAYDLSPERNREKKYGYYVWAHKNGGEENLQNLGSLDRDDSPEHRWTLKVSDAEALANIDRVFVTSEPLNKLGPRPRGKTILNAYLATPPNHP